MQKVDLSKLIGTLIQFHIKTVDSGPKRVFLLEKNPSRYTVGFPMGRDLGQRNKGTEVLSLSREQRDNGTSSKSCQRTGQAGTDRDSQSKPRTRQSKTGK